MLRENEQRQLSLSIRPNNNQTTKNHNKRINIYET